MFDKLTFRDYAHDDAHMEFYSEYQRRYAETIRESDKTIIQLVRRIVDVDAREGTRPTLLDIGCSTGNLLLHLKHLLPNLDLHGGDIVPSIVAGCRRNPELAGIDFSEMDMLNLKSEERFDIIVANAALMFFDDHEFDLAIQNITAAIKKGGWFVAFDYFHPFEQEVCIVETSKLHPKGLKFHFRGYARVKSILEKAQLRNAQFTPFNIGISLVRTNDFTDITSYTVESVAQERMSFRGTLFQPWCHLVAQRTA